MGSVSIFSGLSGGVHKNITIFDAQFIGAYLFNIWEQWLFYIYSLMEI